jgi:hypothetical protein
MKMINKFIYIRILQAICIVLLISSCDQIGKTVLDETPTRGNINKC